MSVLVLNLEHTVNARDMTNAATAQVDCTCLRNMLRLPQSLTSLGSLGT